MADFDPTKTPGAFDAPPDHAPREIAQPLTQDSLTSALERAREHEQPLAPFDPQPGPEKRMGAVAPTKLHAPPRTTPQTHQPAASNSDSPSRGIPKPILDPGKQITGGFGHAGEAQYFPLDGSELREMVRGLMSVLDQRLENDLRFHLAITYPRVRARVVIEVECYAQEGGFSVEHVAVHDKTPMEIARSIADRVAFAVIEERRETADDGTSEYAPDRVRDELGLPKPHKQQIATPGGRMFVDQAHPLDSLF